MNFYFAQRNIRKLCILSRVSLMKTGIDAKKKQDQKIKLLILKELAKYGRNLKPYFCNELHFIFLESTYPQRAYCARNIAVCTFSLITNLHEVPGSWRLARLDFGFRYISLNHRKWCICWLIKQGENWKYSMRYDRKSACAVEMM